MRKADTVLLQILNEHSILVEKAIIALERKSRAGSPSASKQLGRLYRDGELTKQDPIKAKKWLLKSAQLGSVGGMHDYAHLLLKQIKKNRNQTRKKRLTGYKKLQIKDTVEP